MTSSTSVVSGKIVVTNDMDYGVSSIASHTADKQRNSTMIEFEIGWQSFQSEFQPIHCN